MLLIFLFEQIYQQLGSVNVNILFDSSARQDVKGSLTERQRRC